MIILGNIQPEKPHQSQNIYYEGGVAPTIMAGTHGYGFGYVLEIKEIKECLFTEEKQT